MTLNAEDAVDLIVDRVGNHLVVGTPLGIGKPIPLLDAIYLRARADPSLEVEIITALTLSPPAAKSELEERLLNPITERIDGWVAPAYLTDVESDLLPENVSVSEFYLRPGSLIEVDAAQRNHINANYSDVVRDAVSRGINVMAQSVATDKEGRLSLSSNSDLTLDVIAHFDRIDRPTAMVAVVNERLPFVGGDAVIDRDAIDIVVDGNRDGPEPFPVPSEPVSLADYAVGLQAAALIRDGGTIQLGIGSMADAVAAAMMLRDEEPAAFQRALDRLSVNERNGPLIDEIGGREPFREGLYVCSEMLSDSLVALYDSGIVRRRSYPDESLQRLADAGAIEPTATPQTLHQLVELGVVNSPLAEQDLALLAALGLISDSCLMVADNTIELPDGSTVSADLAGEGVAEKLVDSAPGGELNAPMIHAAFFLGSSRLYDRLREIDPNSPDINMTGVAFTNSLDQSPEIKRAQRRSARFVNQGMKVSADGSISAHTLVNGRMVSGVGGQFDFVDMARRLPDGRSISLLTATRSDESNVVPELPHVTIPGQHSDLVITEYGIANLQGKTAEEVMHELIAICDRDHQEELIEFGKRTGRLRPDYEHRVDASLNHPEWLEDRLGPLRDEGILQRFPFGSELTEVELGLVAALRALDSLRDRKSLPGAESLRAAWSVPDEAEPYLRRMDLLDPAGPSETLQQRAVVAGLVSAGVIDDGRN